MKLSKQLEAEVLDVYEAYWGSLLNVDMETYSAVLDNDFKLIGTTEAEVFFKKMEAVRFLKATADQVAGNIELRNRKIKIAPVDSLILITEQSDAYVNIDNVWTFYAKTRTSSLLQKKNDIWKFIQMHISFPDSMAEEGESVALNQIKTENLQLREAVKRRTIELEEKNRELEIDTSLERVRIVAMGMKKPDDILDICKVMFTELRSLGFSNLRNTLINFWDDAGDSLIDYDYSDYAGGNKSKLSYSSHPVFEQFQKKIKKSKDAFAKLIVKKDQLESWKQRRRDSGEYEDPRLNNIPELYYYFYSIGVGAIGISTFSSLTAEKINLLERFRNVFDFAYRRYTDVAQAEAQAKEALIELALERVRARTMAMQHSDELAELVTVVFKELTQLDFHITSSIIWINNPESLTNTLWVTSAEMNQPAQPIQLSPFQHPFFHSIIHAWKEKDPKWIYLLTGKEKSSFEKSFFSGTPGLPKALKSALTVPEKVVFSATFQQFWSTGVNRNSNRFTDEKNDILNALQKYLIKPIPVS